MACAGRTPGPKTAQSISRSFFKHYGNKYDESAFGHKNVDNVVLNAIEEINHNAVYTDAVVTLKGGAPVRVLLKMERHFPTGWRVASWETLSGE